MHRGWWCDEHLLPTLPRAKRVAGRGRGWGATHDVRMRASSRLCQPHAIATGASFVEAQSPQPPTPPRHARKCAWVGGKRERLCYPGVSPKPSHVSASALVDALDFHPPRNIFPASRTDTERAAVVFAAWNGARRSANFADFGCSGTGCPGGVRGRPRQRARTARVHVRATVRTNGGRGHQLQTLGHPASRQIHPRAERRRKTASEARFG